jgi:hypothetical protein
MNSQKKQQYKKPNLVRKTAAVVFAYISACCNLPARKPALVKVPKSKFESDKSKVGLGKWKCPCGKKCKVSRKKAE